LIWWFLLLTRPGSQRLSQKRLVCDNYTSSSNLLASGKNN
jgi:hypothetical protein